MSYILNVKFESCLARILLASGMRTGTVCSSPHLSGLDRSILSDEAEGLSLKQASFLQDGPIVQVARYHTVSVKAI